MSDTQPTFITQAKQLGHRWGDRALFADFDLALPSGVTLVRGEEQSGKTSLLRILAGELRPSSGWVETQGQRADQQPQAYQKLVFRTDPSNEALDPISAAHWFGTLPERYPAFSASVLNGLVEGFGLPPHMDKPLYMLSAGSRRKVWLSAAFASGAALTLIDQPFAALDGPSIRLLREVLQDFSDHPGRACVIADYEAPEGVALACTIEL
jgi:ABC-type transport system involved in cytochrome c biogenesis ATPase subunit